MATEPEVNNMIGNVVKMSMVMCMTLCVINLSVMLVEVRKHVHHCVGKITLMHGFEPPDQGVDVYNTGVIPDQNIPFVLHYI